MAPKITDPDTFLRNLVAKKGKSELEGVTLTSVNVLANAQEDYQYGISEWEIDREVDGIFRRDEEDWNRLLVETRLNDDEIVFPIAFHYKNEPVTIFFIVEGIEMTCMVCIPKLITDEFAIEATVFQAVLKNVARFAGKTAMSIKFCIGSVTVPWNELVDRGEVQEVDVGF
jgi:hypothetical protein